MRQKSTVSSLPYHNQFQKSSEQMTEEINKKSGVAQKEKKEGQSEYRIGVATRKQKP